MLPDYPIEKKEQDKLRRAPLAEKVADMILGFEGPESFVIGIDGPWGTGKSSFINLIKNHLEEKIEIINFNPWLFTSAPLLLADFFKSLAEVVGGDVAEKIKKYGGMVANLADLSISVLWGAVSINPKGILKSFLEKNQSLEKQRADIDKELRKMNKRLVIVVDDIDRLDPEETKLIFKLVKVSANFSKIIFLLAYDKQRVAQRLTETNNGFDGNEYLKKIVQINFRLPEPDRSDLLTILTNDLDETLKQNYSEINIDEKRWSNIFDNGLKELFKTIRDIKSFISTLRLEWKIVSKEDINPVDFIGVEAIRVFATSFHSEMMRHKSLFTGTRWFSGLGAKDDEEARRNQYAKLLEQVEGPLRENINGIVKELFPQIDFHTHYGAEWEEEWLKDRRVCSEEKFPFYFQFGVPSGAVSEVELQAIIKTVKNSQDFIKNLARIDEEGRLLKILDRLTTYTDELSEEEVENFILGVWNVQENGVHERNSIWSLRDVDMVSDMLSFKMLGENIGLPKRKDFLLKLLAKTDALYPGLRFASRVVMENEKNRKERPEEALFDVKDDQEVKAAVVEKLKATAIDGRLKASKKLIMLLYRWKDFGSVEDIKKFVDNLVKTTDGFLTFLTACKMKILSSEGNYSVVETKQLKEFYSLEEAKKRVENLTEGDLKNATEEQREAVELFKNPPKRHY